MKPYGLPRLDGVEWPDVGDIQAFGRASHVGRIKNHTGDYHPYAGRSKKRKSTRRYWKRRARREANTLGQE